MSALDELDQLAAELRDEQKRVQKFRYLIAQASEVQAEVAQHAYEHRTRLAKLKKELCSTREVLPEASAAKLDLELRELTHIVKNSDKIRPSTGSLFVRLFLGKVNVRVVQEADRTRLRDEYNKFKQRTNWMFFILPIVNMFVFYRLHGVWANTNWCNVLTHVWMMYYFVSLALRENILKVNGSNIRPWWILHHYLSAFMSVILLTWPMGPHAQSFLPQFYLYCMVQGLVQMMQAAYQKKRLYIRKAIGKADHMDVAATETLVETPSELYMLLIFIFGVHVFQIYNGVTLGLFVYHKYDYVPWYNFSEEVQASLVAALFIFLGVMNFQQTVMVLVDKRRHNNLVKQRMSSRKLLATKETKTSAGPPAKTTKQA